MEILLIVQRLKGKDEFLGSKLKNEISAFMIMIKRSLELWQSRLDFSRKEISIDKVRKEFMLINTAGNHYAVILKMKKDGERAFILEEKLTMFEAVKKVHKLDNHKRQDQLMTAYRNAG